MRGSPPPATAIQQASFRAGSMAASLPAVTVSEPLVASVLGVAILGEMLRPGRSGWVLLVIAVVVMIAATVELARTEAAPIPDPAESLPG